MLAIGRFLIDENNVDKQFEKRIISGLLKLIV